MFDYDKWQEIFNSISRHKLRTALTAFGVAWGIFMLVLLLGAGKGLQNGVEYMFKDDAVNSIWIYKGTTSMPHKGLKPGRRIQYDNGDFEAIANEVEGLEHMTGRYYLRRGAVVRRGQEVRNFNVRSVHPGHKFVENTEVIKGRFINDIDLKEFRKVTCIGKLVAEGFFKEEEEPIGQTINIKGVEYKIVGIFEDSGGDREMRNIYIPITTAQKVYEGKGLIDQIMVMPKAGEEENIGRIETEIHQKLAERHNFSMDDNQALYINNNLEEFKEFQGFFTAIRTFVWMVGLGSILAGIIGVSNIMLIIVKDRTKEIGVRKALGATPMSIISMIVQEAIFITAIAGYMGLLAGIGLIYTVKTLMVKFDVESEFFRNPEVDMVVVIYALIVLVIAGGLAGLMPAIRAVKINPVIAMKS